MMEEKKMLEKYETPEVDFVEIEENDVIVTSGPCESYGDNSHGTCVPPGM